MIKFSELEAAYRRLQYIKIVVHHSLTVSFGSATLDMYKKESDKILATYPDIDFEMERYNVE